MQLLSILPSKLEPSSWHTKHTSISKDNVPPRPNSTPASLSVTADMAITVRVQCRDSSLLAETDKCKTEEKRLQNASVELERLGAKKRWLKIYSVRVLDLERVSGFKHSPTVSAA